MFEKYRLALTNPKRSPLAPLKKGGTRLLVPRLVRFTVGEPEQYAHPLF